LARLGFAQLTQRQALAANQIIKYPPAERNVMARTIRNARLESRAARRRLDVQTRPYWQELEAGAHLGYVRKDGPGMWVARFYAGGQKYAQEQIGTADDYADGDGTVVLDYRQAQTQARGRLIERKHSAAGITGPLTVRMACESYLEFLEAHRKTAADTRHRFNAFVYPELGDLEVAALKSEHLRAWLMALAKAPARIRTARGKPQQHRHGIDSEFLRCRRVSANRVRTVLFAALNFAYRDGKVASDAAWRQVKPFQAVDAARVRYLTVAEAQRLMNAAPPDFRRLLQSALLSGARYGELGRLQVHDFNPDAGTLAVRRSKSGKPRHVVLTEEGIAFFTQLTAGRPGSELILLKDDGSSWGKSHQDLRMHSACRHAGITPPASIHVMRHTWASLAVMNNMPLMVVARNLGHRDTRMVELHYGHLAPSFISDAIRAGAPRFGITIDSTVTPFERRG
jgi:integrase